MIHRQRMQKKFPKNYELKQQRLIFEQFYGMNIHWTYKEILLQALKNITQWTL